jgi:hypothetical protein
MLHKIISIKCNKVGLLFVSLLLAYFLNKTFYTVLSILKRSSIGSFKETRLPFRRWIRSLYKY